ncbi:MAG: signal peptidase I, partial [Microcoleus sp. SIO2G3]|nr:signal peptidase I [Microcoleus sp. SIO2G3]
MPLSAASGQSSKSPEPWFAVNLSMFFPGIGQLYAGEKLKGLGFIGSEVLLIAIASWSIFSPTGNTATGLICLLLAVTVYIWSLFDAFASANKQLEVNTTEKIPRSVKNPWFAVFLSRILPGLGQLYVEKAVLGAFFLSLIIICSLTASIFPNLLLVVPIISAVASYHAFIALPKRQRQRQNLIIVITVLVLVTGIVASYLPTWIRQEVDFFEIPSKSMLPTLEIGDRVFVRKSRNYLPHQGDVIVFKIPDKAKLLDSDTNNNEERYFIKRVIGEPGEVVSVSNGEVFINNQALQEPYIAAPPAYEWESEAVPPNSYVVMGDNR